ncbi:hypothetical protein NKH77_41195 [Streptomyces sp. M19]
MLLFTGTLAALMLFLMDLERPRWALLPVVAVLAGVLTWWQLRHPRPFIDLRMLGRNRALTLTYLRHGLAYLVIYVVMYGYAQWLEEAHGLSSFHAGLVMLPMSVAAAACSLLSARTKGIRGPLVAAAVLLLAGSAVLLVTGHRAPLAALLLAAVLFGLPQGWSPPATRPPSTARPRATAWGGGRAATHRAVPGRDHRGRADRPLLRVPGVGRRAARGRGDGRGAEPGRPRPDRRRPRTARPDLNPSSSPSRSHVLKETPCPSPHSTRTPRSS